MAPLPPLATVAELETWLQVEAGTAPQGPPHWPWTWRRGCAGEARCPFTERESTASLPVVDGRITPAGPCWTSCP
ncbi:hypothetical protein D3C59_34955 [Streptomyces sp. SHP22-7]|nr:hypothetical protein D3C59_34955 [Streptomyces sp. SHP22-7]